MQSTPFRVRHGIIVETSNNASTTIVANNQVLTGSASNALVDLATAWNTTGNPTAIKLNVTNTASGANSALMDLQVSGNSRFYVSANGNIGIGTSTPTQRLTLIGPSFGLPQTSGTTQTHGAFRIASPGTTGILDFGIGASGTNQWIQSGDTNLAYSYSLLLNPNGGNVGIGTTSPSEKLHVYGSTNIYLKAQSTTTAGAGLWTENSTGWYKWQIDSTRAFSLTDSAGPNRIFVANNGNIGLGDFALSTSGAAYAPKAKLDVAGALSVGYALTDTFSAPSNSLVVSGNIGIGTTAPALQSGGTGIHINGTSYSEIKFTNATTGNLATDGTALVSSGVSFGINNREGGAISFGTSNLERMSIDPSGFVGIGTNAAGITSPTAKFTVASGTSSTSQHIYGTYTDGSNYERINLTANSTGHYVLSEEAGTGTARSLFLGANNATMVTVAANGNIGIGTSSPSQKLHLIGTSGNILIRLDDPVNPRNNYIGVDNYEQVVLAANESNTLGATPYIKFRINASELVRILPSGNFGIGALSPARKLDVYGSGQFSDASGIQTTIWSEATSGTGGVGTNNNYPFTFLTNGSERVRITTAGNVGIGTSTPNTPLDVVGNISSSNTIFALFFDSVSDIAYKENVKPINNPIEILSQLNPVSFDWKTSKIKSYGLIAQEVEKILPSIVHEKSDGTKTVNYIEIIAFLIQAIKHQQQQIDNINNNRTA